MPYIDPWNETEPPGGELARNIDDTIRKFRRQITERLGSILKPTADAIPKSGLYRDPIELLDKYTGQGEKTIIFPPNLTYGTYNTANAGLYTIPTEGCVVIPSSVDDSFMPIQLPPGVTIRKVECQFDRSSSPNVHWKMYRHRMIGANYAPDTLIDKNYVANGPNIDTFVFAPEFITDANDYFYLRFDAGGPNTAVAKFYGVRVTYFTPSNINTY